MINISQVKKNKKTIIGIFVWIVLILIFLFVFLGSESQPIEPEETAESIINLNENREDCSGTVAIGITQEALDRIIYGDEENFGRMFFSGEAIAVGNCTKVSIVNKDFDRWQVRISEGKNIGKEGWAFYNWIK